MKKKIHPRYYPETKVTCVCGNTWVTGSTKEAIKVDVCGKCHPFFTGQQRIARRGGQVERFTKRVERSHKLRDEVEERAKAREERKQARALVEIIDEEESIEPIEEVPESEADQE